MPEIGLPGITRQPLLPIISKSTLILKLRRMNGSRQEAAIDDARFQQPAIDGRDQNTAGHAKGQWCLHPIFVSVYSFGVRIQLYSCSSSS